MRTSARGRAVCHPRLRSGCRSVDLGVGEFFRAVDNQDVAHFLTQGETFADYSTSQSGTVKLANVQSLLRI